MGTMIPDLLPAICVTVRLSVLSLSLGLVLAALVAYMQVRRVPVLSQAAFAYALYFRGTPLLVQLFLIYYGAGQMRGAIEAVGLWWFFQSPWLCALLAFTLNTGAYTSEILVGAARAVPLAQIEGARALGMSKFLVFRFVHVPNMLRASWPAYSNEVIFQLQATSLASLVTLMDITGVARRAAASTFEFFGVYSLAALIYLVMVFALTSVFRRVEIRLGLTTR
jgi:His/Glu/Gln/Arg/opine family amino acid ABC transporter permease subunit